MQRINTYSLNKSLNGGVGVGFHHAALKHRFILLLTFRAAVIPATTPALVLPSEGFHGNKTPHCPRRPTPSHLFPFTDNLLKRSPCLGSRFAQLTARQQHLPHRLRLISVPARLALIPEARPCTHHIRL